MDEAALARPERRRPAGIEPVGRRHREQAHVAAIFRHEANGLDRLGRDGAGVSDDDLTIRSRRP